jgi:calcineurin-like phosphoesterase family protein
MIYFTSDLHLGHQNIIRLCNRPFSTVEEMDETLIENWNRRVGKDDLVYLLGDIVWSRKKVPDYMDRLSGRKILISTGNHDAAWVKREEYHVYFESVVPYLETKLCGHPVTLCHYPLLEWKDSREEAEAKLGYLIHGHIHNRVSEEYRMLYIRHNALNAGVDINHFAPATFEELLENNRIFKLDALASMDFAEDRDRLLAEYAQMRS